MRSRECPRYKLEQDILQLANSQYISLGSARRELLYRRKDGTGATTYASSLGARSFAQPAAAHMSTSAVASRHSDAFVPAVPSANRFSPLSCDSVESPACSDSAPQALTKGTLVVDVHASPKRSRGQQKRYRGSSESVDSVHVPPTKVSVAVRDCVVSKGRSAKVATEAPLQPAGTSSDMEPVLSPVVVSSQTMETEDSIPGDGVATASCEPGSGMQSVLPAAAPTDTVSPCVRSKPDIKSPVPKPGPSRVPVSFPAGPYGLASSRRVSLPSQVGKGKSRPGAPPKPGTK